MPQSADDHETGRSAPTSAGRAARSPADGDGDVLPATLAGLIADGLEEVGVDPADARLLVAGLADGAGGDRFRLAARVLEHARGHGLEVAGFDRSLHPAEASDALDVPVQSSFDPSGFDAVLVLTPDPAFRTDRLGELAAALGEDGVLVDATGAVDPVAAAEHDLHAVTQWGV